MVPNFYYISVVKCTVYDKANSSRDPVDAQVSYNEAVNYTCTTGYEPSDVQTARCLENGTLSATSECTGEQQRAYMYDFFMCVYSFCVCDVFVYVCMYVMCVFMCVCM